MSKQKKKRNKRYAGDDAKWRGENITTYSVGDKSKTKRFYDDNKIQIYTRLFQLGLLLFLGFGIYWLFIR